MAIFKVFFGDLHGLSKVFWKFYWYTLHNCGKGVYLQYNNLKKINKIEKKLKLSKFGTFSIRAKKSRIGRNPKTKEQTTISNRDVVLFKASKEFKDLVNSKNDS